MAVCTTLLKIKAPFDLYIFNAKVTLSFALVDWMIQSCWVQSGRTGEVKAPSSQPRPSADNVTMASALPDTNQEFYFELFTPRTFDSYSLNVVV